MNVLITSVSRKVSLVQAFRTALAKCGGGAVVAVDISAYAPALYVADRHFLVPRSDEPDFLGGLIRLCQHEQIRLLIPTRDEELLLFARNIRSFEEIGVRVMVSPAESVRICQDKKAFIAFCQDRGFGIPHTYSADNWKQANFPLFLKPRFGKGGKGARSVSSERELRELLDSSSDWIIQECVSAPEYTVDLFADFSGQILSVVPRLRQYVIAGESYVSRTVDEPRLIEESARLATELRLVGHNTIQCFWDGQHVRFIEVNPRFGGAATLGIAAGANSPEMLLQLLQGNSLPSRVSQYSQNLVMLRYTQDLFLNSEALTPGLYHREHHYASTDLQAVLFDLDNTLYREEDFVRSGFRATAGFLAAREGLDEEKVFSRMLEILQKFGRGTVFDILLTELKIDCKVWLKTLLYIYRSHLPAIALFPEVPALFSELKRIGVKLAIVTDGLASVQRRKSAALGLNKYVDFIICTDDLGKGCAKPSTVPFEVALKMLGIRAEQAAYVGDDLWKDFAGPNLLGMKTVQVHSQGLIGVPVCTPSGPEYSPNVQAESLSVAVHTLLGNIA